MISKRRAGVALAALLASILLLGCSGEEGAVQSSSTTQPSQADSPEGSSDTDSSEDKSQASPGASVPTDKGSELEQPKTTPTPDPMANDDGEPGMRDKKGRQSVVLDRVPGSSKVSCVEVGAQRDLRSGGFVGGPFDDAIASYDTKRDGFGKRDVRMYFVPLHAAKLQTLTLTGTGPSGAKAKVVRVTKADTEKWRFYDTTVRLPANGRWTFRLSSGPDKGCFVVDF